MRRGFPKLGFWGIPRLGTLLVPQPHGSVGQCTHQERSRPSVDLVEAQGLYNTRGMSQTGDQGPTKLEEILNFELESIGVKAVQLMLHGFVALKDLKYNGMLEFSLR